MKEKLLMLAGGLCFTLGTVGLQAQEMSTNLQVYTFDEVQQKEWFGVCINGVSDNGRYAVGHDQKFTQKAVIWDLDTRTFKQITGSYEEKARVYDVSDDGTVVGVFADETLEETKTAMVPGYWKDGKWTALPLTEGVEVVSLDGNGYANAISADGKIIVGYVLDWFYWEAKQKNITLYRPAVWIDGVLQPMYDEIPVREELGIGNGTYPFYSSADGKIWGGKFEHKDGSRSPAVWIDGEVTRIYGEELDPEYFFDGAVLGLSPSGKYALGYFAPQGGAEGMFAFVYNTETKETEKLESSWGMTTQALDDGTIYGSTGYTGSTLIRTKDFNGSFVDYLVEKYGLNADELEFSPCNVNAVSADGKVIGGYYIAPAGFTSGMLPYIVVLDHPLSVQTAKNVQSLRMEGDEVFAEGAEHIELYDVSGCKLNSIAGDRISVIGLNGVVIAKAYFSNGETGHAKFVVR